MITPQDIREKAFGNAVRGYNVDAVDEFLDEIADDYTALVKENSSLKSKMRVLVEKIEEYRQTEDSMRLALLSAQKMSAQIEAEAKERAEKLVSEAQAKADNAQREAQASIANELAKLSEAKKATQKYVDHMTAVCQKQIEFYGRLADAQLVGAPKTESAPAAEPEDDEDDTLFPLEGDGIDVSSVLETCFILQTDMRFLCRPDCRGLCPRCGKNLNDGPCGCTEDVDPRLAVLGQLLDDT